MHPEIHDEHLLVHEIGEEYVVYHRRHRRAHRLNPTVSAVWRRLDGTHSAEEIAESMGCDLSVVQLALRQLEDAHLLKNSQPQPVSRRSALRKVAAVAAIGVALPVISSIPAPTAAHAQSAAVCATSAGTSGTTYGTTASATSSRNAGTSGTSCSAAGHTMLIERDGVYYEVAQTKGENA